MQFRFLGLIVAILIATQSSFGQGAGNDPLGRDSIRIVSAAVPFLTISPDARSAAMGDAGVAISPDANSIYWNPAKLPFTEKGYGVSISYTPWLRKLIDDMSLSYLSAYTKLRKEEAIGLSLLYFDLGDMQFTDKNGDPIADFRPREFMASATYARQLSDYLGVALSLKFIHSNLSGGIFIDGTQTKAGNTAGGDIATYYNRENWFNINGYKFDVAFGGMISNIGAKISYSNNDQKDFIPTNLKLGTAVTSHIDEYNKFTLALDFNKLMVPTPPVRDTNGVIVAGKDPNRPLISGMFGSFGDAPDGFKEEINEIMISVGLEYWYNNLFAARAGYFYEHATKGNRKYFTLGVGLRYQVFGLDFAYLIPQQQNHPLAETLRFTLSFNFDKKDGSDGKSVTDQ